MRIIIIIALCLICSASTFAGSLTNKAKDDTLRGWWWYEIETEKPAVEKDKLKEAKPDRILPSLKDYTSEQLWNMHPDDFQPLVQDFLKKAVQTPTIDNVKDFYVMVDIARMKSHVFQNVAGAVWQQYPNMSLNADLPTSALGRTMKVKMQVNEVKSRISEAAADFALVYFYAENCEFCKAEDSVIKGFIDKYGWEVKRVEINDDPALAARFEVKVTPYLMLIYRDSKEYFPVAIGVSSREEIEERIYRGIRLLTGEVSPESYTMHDFQRGGKMDPADYMKSDSEDLR